MMYFAQNLKFLRGKRNLNQNDLAHGNLDDDAIVKGFQKHYALLDQTIGNVQQDLHFHTPYYDFYMEAAMSGLRRALGVQIEAPSRSEMRTLEEVSMIVQAVRAGERVQVDYYDPEKEKLHGKT